MHEIGYPRGVGQGIVRSLFTSAGHNAPLLKVQVNNEMFYTPAFNGALIGQAVQIGGTVIKDGNVVFVKDVPIGTQIFNIERNPGDGGKMIRTAGGSAMVHKVYEHNKMGIMMPNKHEVVVDGNCRVTIGCIAGQGKKLKPFITAGRMFYAKKAKGKLWPRTSAVKMNAVDHPFGSGRGKRIKSKIAKRNAPPGARVGHIRPRRTGRTK
jgi:large subunit ribosomal protein L2